MKKMIVILIVLIITHDAKTQSFNDTALWHGKERENRYHPQGTDFVLTNGKTRFARELDGNNTGFRIEAGELPEFALHMPGMGGNLRFVIIGRKKERRRN